MYFRMAFRAYPRNLDQGDSKWESCRKMKWGVWQQLTQRYFANILSSDLFPIRSGKGMRCAGSKDGSNESPWGPCFIFSVGEFLGLGFSGVSTFDFSSDLKVR